MKTSSSAIKILTLSVFATLIILFVCYRVGVFDNDSVSQTYSEVNLSDFESNSLNAIDTPVVNNDSILMDREMMSSSKSMRISRPVKQDTTKKSTVVNQSTTAPSNNNNQTQKSNYMGSSKSAVIFEPPLQLVDTAKKPKK